MPRKVSLDELNRLTVEDFKTADKYPYVLILDNVRSLNNVGSVFRTADAFRAEKIYLCGITGTPPHRDITKTALGATESVDWEHVQDVVGLIDRLKQEGWIIAAIEQAEGSVGLQDFEPLANKKFAFVFGNEVAGVNSSIIEKADLVLEIPQYGTKHSLNIAVSAGIVCWDFLTKLNKNLTH
ncbi:RNA methyltransferase [Larkinella sp. C7]|uniref:RNA methyltransferase n=1 Tax=Larkinella sp. C7 TaxID=2576607 RepID=UPI0011112927|nr:RNA methyltransferase [Larkinella sp. C7]